MTPQEAYNIVKEKTGSRIIFACYDYKNYYLFSTLPKGFENRNQMNGHLPNLPLDSTFVVDKSNSKVSIYNPMRIELGEDYEIIEDFR